MFFSFRKSGGYVHFSSKVDVLWQIWLQQQSNRKSKIEFWMREGYQLFQFFVVGFLQFVGIDQFRGGHKLWILHILWFVFFGVAKIFLSGKVSFDIGIFGCPQKFQLTSKNGHVLQITKSKNRCCFFVM